jgi:Lar family restriction alleviation protein
MTNGEKFKTAEERRIAYCRYSVGCLKYKYVTAIMDEFVWLESEVEEELRPCPFCGSTPVMANNMESMRSLSYYVKCACGARFASALSVSAAAEMWNRRVK